MVARQSEDNMRSSARNTALCLVVVSLGLFQTAGRVLAHHAFAAEFDANKKVTMTGTIAEMQWINPHAWLWITVKGADGKDERWGLEFGPPNALFRRGWSKKSVPVGAEVTVVAYLAKDGRKIANADQVTLPGGKKLFAGTSGSGAPADSNR